MRRALFPILVTTIAWAEPSLAQNNAADDLSAILNQLEDNLLTGGKTSQELGEQRKAETAYSTGTTKLDVDPFDKDAIGRISKLVNELASKTKDLEAATLDIQKMVARDSSLNNVTSLILDPTIEGKGNIISLSVKVDGLEIYNQDQKSSLWSTNKKIPIFRGPMEVGNHDVEYYAKIKHSRPNEIKGVQNKISSVTGKFSITIAEGKTRPKWESRFEAGQGSFQLKLVDGKETPKPKKTKAPATKEKK